jgi:hypothetical protein
MTRGILAALSKTGVFRLRAVLVGTVAYQTYSAMLDVKLAAPSLTKLGQPTSALQTADVDIAQFKKISVAMAG